MNNSCNAYGTFGEFRYNMQVDRALLREGVKKKKKKEKGKE